MSFKVDDTKWRDTVRSFFLHLWGESLKGQPEDIEGTFHDNDGIGHDFCGKAGLRGTIRKSRAQPS